MRKWLVQLKLACRAYNASHSFLDMRIVSQKLSTAINTAKDIEDIEEPLKDLLHLVEEDDILGLPDEDKIFKRIAGLPFSLNEAIHYLGMTRIINQRIQDGFYSDRLVLIATQEKSSSTLHELAILEMLRYKVGVKTIVPIPRSLNSGPCVMAGGKSFHHGILLYFPNGGGEPWRLFSNTRKCIVLQ